MKTYNADEIPWDAPEEVRQEFIANMIIQAKKDFWEKRRNRSFDDEDPPARATDKPSPEEDLPF